MSRARFVALRNAFHMVDASSAPGNNNKVWKVLPVLDAVRNVCLSLPWGHVTYSVDEQMIQFTGCCPLRQFVKNKPQPVGLKNFVLTTSAGLVLDYEIYQADATPLQTKEFGLGPSVMLRLAQTLPQESFIYFDRYFTSLSLLEKLTEMKLYGSGTIMANRLKGLPLSDASKVVRGQSIEHVAENCDLVVVEWKDSNKVIMASNCCGSTLTEPVQHWSKIDNKHVEVDCPSVVHKYNQNMGGVDVCAQQMECYRAWFRSMKWAWKAILHFVDLAVLNAWNQYMRSIKGNNIPRKEQKDLLHFKL
ncbi:piggyBac transposable element-derived protein 2-like [Schistocerca cancellata]|uniref:piggyBac transposable element-derived protein 2-like n=1 Tax=Schistocerca cancellata TaxID=274614 RepID=UPI002119A41C|nr:piggyBac transposable element-derived protein 2-like [Schistocerca cancellata]XP_049776025.1 piggyBac transposable element-derived protein 2-like [Schistocerca cancellata]